MARLKKHRPRPNRPPKNPGWGSNGAPPPAFMIIAGKINPRWVALAFIVLFAITIIRLAWLSDDYSITLREVAHFLEGRGIVFNPGVRVQAFTHVLWFLLLSGAQFITREHYLTTIALSAALSLGAIAVMLRWAYQYQYPQTDPQPPHAAVFAAAVPLLALLFSYSFMDFTTSGLENCLAYLLFSLFIYCLVDRQLDAARLYLLALICATIVLNRFDHALLILPAVFYALMRYQQRMIGPLLLGGGIVLAWLAFATFYFGFPLPNTFYAKLGTGHPLHEYLSRGISYYGVQLATDPIALALIALGVHAGFKRPGFVRCLAICPGSDTYKTEPLRKR